MTRALTECSTTRRTAAARRRGSAATGPRRSLAQHSSEQARPGLTTGYIDKSGTLAARLADTGIGIVVGLVVNLVVWPPLRDRSAANQIDVIDNRLGDLLAEIAVQLRGRPTAEDIDGWITRADELADEIARAWSFLQEARESGREPAPCGS